MLKILVIYMYATLAIFILAGCGPASSTLETSALSSTSTPVSSTTTEIVTVAPIPIHTSISNVSPTLSPDQEQAYSKLSELLSNNGGCDLPCWWGLSPGQATFMDAQEKLDPLSLVSDFYFTGDRGGIYISYPVDNLFIPISVEYSAIHDNSQSQDTISMLNVSTYLYQQIDLGNGDFLNKEIYDAKVYNEILSAYTLHAILSKYGPPSDILFRAEAYASSPIPNRAFITILYPAKGIFIKYTMLGERIASNLSACPAKSFIDLWLLSEGIGDQYLEVLSTLDENWESNFANIQSYEEATQMTVQEFYETFKEPTDKCVQTPVDMWLIH